MRSKGKAISSGISLLGWAVLCTTFVTPAQAIFHRRHLLSATEPATYFGPVPSDVHFRDDMLAGNAIREQVANAVMEKVHLDGSRGGRSKRVLGQPLVTSAFFGDVGPNYH